MSCKMPQTSQFSNRVTLYFEHHFSFYLWKNFVTGSVEMHITNAKRMNIFLEIHNTHKNK